MRGVCEKRALPARSTSTEHRSDRRRAALPAPPLVLSSPHLGPQAAPEQVCVGRLARLAALAPLQDCRGEEKGTGHEEDALDACMHAGSLRQLQAGCPQGGAAKRTPRTRLGPGEGEQLLLQAARPAHGALQLAEGQRELARLRLLALVAAAEGGRWGGGGACVCGGGEGSLRGGWLRGGLKGPLELQAQALEADGDNSALAAQARRRRPPHPCWRSSARMTFVALLTARL